MSGGNIFQTKKIAPFVSSVAKYFILNIERKRSINWPKINWPKMAIIRLRIYSFKRFHSFSSYTFRVICFFLCCRILEFRSAKYRLDCANWNRWVLLPRFILNFGRIGSSTWKDPPWFTRTKVFRFRGKFPLQRFYILGFLHSFLLKDLPSRLIALSHGSYFLSTVRTIEYDFANFPFIHSHYCIGYYFLNFFASDAFAIDLATRISRIIQPVYCIPVSRKIVISTSSCQSCFAWLHPKVAAGSASFTRGGSRGYYTASDPGLSSWM